MISRLGVSLLDLVCWHSNILCTSVSLGLPQGLDSLGIGIFSVVWWHIICGSTDLTSGVNDWMCWHKSCILIGGTLSSVGDSGSRRQLCRLCWSMSDDATLPDRALAWLKCYNIDAKQFYKLCCLSAKQILGFSWLFSFAKASFPSKRRIWWIHGVLLRIWCQDYLHRVIRIPQCCFVLSSCEILYPSLKKNMEIEHSSKLTKVKSMRVFAGWSMENLNVFEQQTALQTNEKKQKLLRKIQHANFLR